MGDLGRSNGRYPDALADTLARGEAYFLFIKPYLQKALGFPLTYRSTAYELFHIGETKHRSTLFRAKV